MRCTLLAAALVAVIAVAVAFAKPDPPAAVTPALQPRIAKLEKRVARLEQQMASLRTLVCLQLPAC